MLEGKKMRAPKTNYLSILGLIGFLCLSAPAAGETVTRQQLFQSLPTPVEKVQLVWTVGLRDADDILGAVALYDDAGTARPVDYMELFNRAGDLVAFGWFDQFGIERVAVDDALIDGAQTPAGTFHILVGGEAV
jgi:hypothetical protein